MSVRLEALDPAGADHDALLAFLTGETFPFHVRPRLDAAEAERRIAEGSFGDDEHRAWWVLDDGRRVGTVVLAGRRDETPVLDLRLRAAARGRGIGTLALRALAEEVFEAAGAPDRLEGCTREDNAGMRRAFAKAGWVQEARYREAWPVEGGAPRDSTGYGLLRREWRASRGRSTGVRAASPVLQWRGGFEDVEIEALHDGASAAAAPAAAVRRRVERWSLGWVTAREAERLVGFVNVAWDGGLHAFLLDTATAADRRRHGIGAALIARAAEGALEAGCDWLHVDFEPHLRSFYLRACGFAPTSAGLVALRDRSRAPQDP